MVVQPLILSNQRDWQWIMRCHSTGCPSIFGAAQEMGRIKRTFQVISAIFAYFNAFSTKPAERNPAICLAVVPVGFGTEAEWDHTLYYMYILSRITDLGRLSGHDNYQWMYT